MNREKEKKEKKERINVLVRKKGTFREKEIIILN